MSWLSRFLGYAEVEAKTAPIKVEVSATTAQVAPSLVARIETTIANEFKKAKAVETEIVADIDGLISSSRVTLDKMTTLAQTKLAQADALAKSIETQTAARGKLIAEAAVASKLALSLKTAIDAAAPPPVVKTTDVTNAAAPTNTPILSAAPVA